SLVADPSAVRGLRVDETASGIQSGADLRSGSPVRLYAGAKRELYDETNNIETDVVVEFLTPVQQPQFPPPTSGVDVEYLTQLAGDNLKATVTITKRSTVPDPNQEVQQPRSRRVEERTVIGSPRKQRPGDTEPWYFPV